MKPNLVTRSVGPLLILRQNAAPPSDLDWAESIRQLKVLLREFGTDVRALIRTDGGAPNQAQRGILGKALANSPIPTAVVTDDVTARMVSSTVALSNRLHRSFAVGALHDAYVYVGLSPEQRRVVDEALKVMETLLA